MGVSEMHRFHHGDHPGVVVECLLNELAQESYSNAFSRCMSGFCGQTLVTEIGRCPRSVKKESVVAVWTFFQERGVRSGDFQRSNWIEDMSRSGFPAGLAGFPHPPSKLRSVDLRLSCARTQ